MTVTVVYLSLYSNPRAQHFNAKQVLFLLLSSTQVFRLLGKFRLTKVLIKSPSSFIGVENTTNRTKTMPAQFL